MPTLMGSWVGDGINGPLEPIPNLKAEFASLDCGKSILITGHLTRIIKESTGEFRPYSDPNIRVVVKKHKSPGIDGWIEGPINS